MAKTINLFLFCAPLLAMRMLAADSAAVPGAQDLQRLREQIAKQQEEIKRLQASLEEQQRMLDKAMATLSAIPATAVNVAPVAYNLPRAQKPEAAPPSPLAIRLGNTELTPLGFMDMTFFARSTNVGSGIGTNFFGIPYNNAAGGKLSETNFSAQNSRVGFRADSNVLGAKVLGYLEADFLFNNNSNSFQVTSNSAGLRLRNYFVDVQKGGFEVLGGQDWSFLTPNRKGLSPLPSDIFYTQDIDTNYQLGLVWSRAPQFRFIAHPSDDFAFGVALENPQQYIGGGAGSSTVTLPANLSGALASQFQSGQSTAGIPNLFPDIIVKAAYDGHAGDKLDHVEAAGLITGFQDYVPSTITTAVSGKHTAIGFGGEVNFSLELVKNFRVVSNNFWTQGGGRYIFGAAPDLVVRPDGSISPLHAGSTVDGFEAQVTPKSFFAAYYGGVYIGRDVVFDNTAGRPVYAGYGYPGSNQARSGQEITFDWIQTLWKNRNYGALALINQYSYLWKDPWSIPAGGPKQAHSNLIYVNLRYTLP